MFQDRKVNSSIFVYSQLCYNTMYERICMFTDRNITALFIRGFVFIDRKVSALHLWEKRVMLIERNVKLYIWERSYFKNRNVLHQVLYNFKQVLQH